MMSYNHNSLIVVLLITFLLLPIILSTTYASDEEWKTTYTVGKFFFSEPLKPDQIFKIQYRVINGTIEKFNLKPGSGVPMSASSIHSIVNSTSDENGILEIAFPRSYPYTNDPDGTEGRNAVIFINDQEIVFEDIYVDNCFFVFSIPFTGNNKINLAWSYLTINSPHHGDSISNNCISQTVVENIPVRKDGTVSPLHQLKAGIITENIHCNQNFTLVEKSTNNQPACVKESTISKLIKRGWAKPT